MDLIFGGRAGSGAPADIKELWCIGGGTLRGLAQCCVLRSGARALAGAALRFWDTCSLPFVPLRSGGWKLETCMGTLCRDTPTHLSRTRCTIRPPAHVRTPKLRGGILWSQLHAVSRTTAGQPPLLHAASVPKWAAVYSVLRGAPWFGRTGVCVCAVTSSSHARVARDR